MIYLERFRFPTYDEEFNLLTDTEYDSPSVYPFGILCERGLHSLDFTEITILYGGNGSGMADGADSLAIRYAYERKLTKILFPANWKKYHRIAGFLRNEDMLSIASHLIVFWDGKSSGTNHMIEIAKAKGIPVWGLKHPCASCTGEFHLERL